MSMSMVKYRGNLLPRPDLTIILGIPNYDTLHQMQLELKTSALSIHSNLRGATHRHFGILMRDTKHATLSNIPCLCPTHPVILLIPNHSTCVASYKLKCSYKKNIQFSHKVRGVKQALIQQIVTDVDEQYIISIKKGLQENSQETYANFYPTYSPHMENFTEPDQLFWKRKWPKYIMACSPQSTIFPINLKIF